MIDNAYGGFKVGDKIPPRPPDDFESLEALTSFARHADLPEEVRNVLDVVWKRFRVWREYQRCYERVWAIENDEDLD